MMELPNATIGLSDNGQLIMRIGGVKLVHQLTRMELERVKRATVVRVDDSTDLGAVLADSVTMAQATKAADMRLPRVSAIRLPERP